MQVLKQGLTGLADGAEFDLVVIGAGGAGLSAAVYAAIDGAKVLVVEHTELVGGTTAWSAGTTWVPGTHHSASVNPTDTLADAATYMNHAVGTQAPAALRDAFCITVRKRSPKSNRIRPCAFAPTLNTRTTSVICRAPLCVVGL